MSLYLPNPCLQGILLTISTHNGPQLVFHYPPKPRSYGYKATPFTVDNDLLSSEDSSSDTSDSELSSDEDQDVMNTLDKKLGNKLRADNIANYTSGQTLLDLLDEQDKRRAAREKRRRNQNRKKGSISSSSLRKSNTNSEVNSVVNHHHHQQNHHNDKVFGFDVEFLSEFVSPPKQLCNSRFELTVDDMAFLGLPIHVNDDGFWRSHKPKRDQKSKHSGNTSAQNTSKGDSDNEDAAQSTNGDHRKDDDNNTGREPRDEPPNNDEHEKELSSMNMFHIVFVMNPPMVEYNYRIDEMFHYVVSRLSLVLRYEQAKSNYVWNEVQKILKIKENNENLSIYDLYLKLNAESSLANAVSQCFDSISTSNIANLEINDKLISLQIPIKNQFSSLLPKTTPVLPGSHLSSTTKYSEEEMDHNMAYMALILLDEPDKIIVDLKTEPLSPLANFIRNIHPMMSLNKLSMINQLDINQVKSFANHLIYWRRARAIVPLQTKSVFIVSPMAPMEYIDEGMKTFRQEFPSLPSLPSFLALLSSSKPRQYLTIIPSKDHKDVYLDALAWLIRQGYVTQLMTFVWLKISNRIKLAVEEDLEREGIAKRNKDKFKFTDISTDNTSKDKDGKSSKKETDGESQTSERRIMLNGQEFEIEEEEEEDTILLDPERATAVERRWTSKCIKGQSPEIAALFHRMLKYFNGKTPLELIIVRENISRHELKKLLNGISEHIISVKHW